MNPVRCLLAWLLFSLGTPAGLAQAMPEKAGSTQEKQALSPAVMAALEPQIKTLLQQRIETIVAQFSNPQDLRSEIFLGQLHPALKVQPCQRIEPALPAHLHAWGKIQVALRCLDAQVRWQIYLPVEIKVFGPVLVTGRALNSGELASPGDLRIETVELTSYALSHARQMLSQPDQLNGHLLTRNLPASQPLRNDFLRAPPVVASGDTVRVLMLGEGFAVTAQGKALQAAGAGQAVRVQVENGRILTGTARLNREVEVRL